MAKNLRAKIPATDTLIIRDVNEAASKRFVEETRETVRSSGLEPGSMKVVVAQNAREIAEQSVSTHSVFSFVTYGDRPRPMEDTIRAASMVASVMFCCAVLCIVGQARVAAIVSREIF